MTYSYTFNRNLFKNNTKGRLLNISHPLIRDLKIACAFNTGAGNPTDNGPYRNGLVSSVYPTSWTGSPYGSGLTTSGDGVANNGEAVVMSEYPLAGGNTPYTLFSIFRLVSNNNNPGDDLINLGNFSLNSNTHILLTVQSGSIFNSWFGNDLSATFSPPANTWNSASFTYDKAIGRNIYVNGLSIASDVPTGAAFNLNVTANKALLGSTGGVGGRTGFRGTVACIYIWQRALSAAEVLWLHRDPFDMYDPPSYRKYWWRAVSGAAAGQKDVAIFSGVPM